MAQQVVYIKRSTVAGKVPTTSQLAVGELAMNVTDGKLYMKKVVGAVENVIEVGKEYVHPTSGVTAGTYKSVTVNAEGHVTGGSNPTTLAGYGIIDAAPLSHVGTGGAAHLNATTSAAGFMSAADKTKLDGIGSGANVTSVAGKTGVVTLTNADVGLGMVENKSSLDIRNEITAQNVKTSLGYTPENVAAKNVASGYAGLDSNGKIFQSQLPSIAITDTFVVATQAAMLALSADVGDVAVRTDLNKTFILKTAGAATLANWQEMLTPTDTVLSVNGMVGAVTVTNITGSAGSVPWSGVTGKPTSLGGYGITDAAPINSPAFTGLPTAPTPTLDTSNLSQVATVEFVKKFNEQFGAPMVRQTVQSSRTDVKGYADFLEAYGDATTKHLLHFDTTTSILVSGAAVDAHVDSVYVPSITKDYWRGYNSAVLDSSQLKFGTASIKLEGGANRYIRQFGATAQYNTSTNSGRWTEEFWFRPSTKSSTSSNCVIFRARDGSGHGVHIAFDSTNKLRLHLSSNGSSWNILSNKQGTTALNWTAWNHIALVFDGSKYTLYLNGTADIVANTTLKICAITYRQFGESSLSCQGWIDEYRFSRAAIYTTSFTPPSGQFVYQISKKVNIFASAEDPIVASFARGSEEVKTKVIAPILTADLVPYNTNFVYLDYNPTTGDVTYGSTVIPPQYGQAVDTSEMALLKFDSGQPVDDYGNVWFDNNVTYSSAMTGGVQYYAQLNDSTSFLGSEIASIPDRFTMRARVYFITMTNSDTIFAYRLPSSSGYGVLVRVSSNKLQTYISSNGTSWDIANASAGFSTMAGGNWYDIELSFDGQSYKLYLNGMLQNVWASTKPPRAALMTSTTRPGVTVGCAATSATAYTNVLNGYIAEFQLIPYVKHGGGTTLGSQVFTVDNTVYASIEQDIHFFDVGNMRMSLVDDVSTTPGMPPDANTRVSRLFLGEATLDGTGVIGLSTYAINGMYFSGWYPVMAGGAYQLQHNIGTDMYDIHNYVNFIPKNTARREETGMTYDTTTSTDAYGATTTSGRYYGSERILSRNNLDLNIGGGAISNPGVMNVSNGFYNTVIRRKF
jgi:hypothetical protein